MIEDAMAKCFHDGKRYGDSCYVEVCGQCHDPWDLPFDCGAAVAFGLVGMADAIRRRYPVCWCGAVGANREGIYMRCDHGHYSQDGGGAWM